MGQESSSDDLGRRVRALTDTSDQLAERGALERARRKLVARGKPIVLSRYVLLDKLGSGGRGVVYRAYDPSLERTVAIKLLRPNAPGEDDATGHARLVREAQAIAQLAHPNVIAVYDVGTFAPDELDGIGADSRAGVFVVMEFVAGETLGAWLRKEPRSWREIQKVFVQAGRGLAAAHAGGLIHRDFKPANVLIGDDGRVRVLDFGLARLLGPRSRSGSDSESAPDSPANAHAVTVELLDDEPPTPASLRSDRADLQAPLTQVGTVMGTPAYMAPEQHVADREIDARTDQYSFCLALYEALYGKRPFAGKTARDLYRAKREGAPTAPPPGRAVPDPLFRIARRGLSKDPAERFESMEALLAELERDPHARRRQVIGAISIGALIVAGLAGASTYQAYEEQACADQGSHLSGIWNEERRTGLAALFEADERAFVPELWEHVRGRLDDYASQWVSASAAHCRSNRAGEASARELELQRLCLDLRAASLRTVVDELGEGGRRSIATSADLVALLEPIELCEDPHWLRDLVAVPGRERGQTIGLHADLVRAQALAIRGETGTADAVLQEVQRRAEDTGDKAVTAQALLSLGQLAARRRDRERSIQLLYAGWSSAEESRDERTAAAIVIELVPAHLLGEPQIEIATGLVDVARGKLEALEDVGLLEAQLAEATWNLRWMQGRDDDAVEESRRAIALYEKALGEHHPALLKALFGFGQALNTRGKFTDARAAYAQAEEIVLHGLGPEHPKMIDVLAGQVGHEWGLGNMAEAQRLAERRLDLSRLVHGPRSEGYVQALHAAGDIYVNRGDVERGRATHQEALELRRKLYGEDAMKTASSHGKVAAALNAEGKHEEALLHADAGLAVLGRDSDSAWYHSALMRRAKILVEADRLDEARAQYEFVAQLFQKRADESEQARLALAESKVGLARIHLAHGERAAAVSMIDDALQTLGGLESTDMRLTDARFVLAQAIFHDEPARAIGLARRARDTYARYGETNRHYQSIRAWLEQAEASRE